MINLNGEAGRERGEEGAGGLDPVHDYILKASQEDLREICEGAGLDPEKEAQWVGDTIRKVLANRKIAASAEPQRAFGPIREALEAALGKSDFIRTCYNREKIVDVILESYPNLVLNPSEFREKIAKQMRQSAYENEQATGKSWEKVSAPTRIHWCAEADKVLALLGEAPPTKEAEPSPEQTNPGETK